MTEATPRVAFVLEQTLGHITHGDNLRRLIPRSTEIDATFLPIEFELSGRASRIPGYGNWTVRAGLRARQAVREASRQGRLDALFVHTQVPAVLIPDVMHRIPTVVSLDATPRQYDELGTHYAHDVGHPAIESLKARANRSCYGRAAHLVVWASWTKQGLVDEYGVDADDVTVIPPGVDPELWRRSEPRYDDEGPVRILFVGGDLRRKGGDLLIDVVRRMRESDDAGAVELHLATSADIESETGITVHRGLTPNSEALIRLYHDSDVFCLPTLGDCLPMVLSEAGAAELPMISTRVGAIPEIVIEGETGLLIDVGDGDALERALRRLVADRGLRERLGRRASEVVSERFDAAANASKLASLMADVARDRAR